MTPNAFKASEHIHQLRTSRGMTQAQFAERLDVDQSRVSQWEAGDATPSAETWIKLGALAANGDPAEAALFWRQTGIEPEVLFGLAAALMREGEGNMGAILPIAEEILKQRVGDQGALEEQGKIALVPPFTEGAWKTQESLPALALPAVDVPHMASTYYLVAGEPPQSSLGYSCGDRIVFDAADASMRVLAPFLGQTALVNFLRSGRPPVLPPPRQTAHGAPGPEWPLWPLGLVVGRLRLAGLEDQTGTCRIMLVRPDRPERGYVNIWDGIALAQFEPDVELRKEGRARLRGLLEAGIGGPPYYEEETNFWAEVTSGVTAHKDCEIMGRVVAMLHRNA